MSNTSVYGPPQLPHENLLSTGFHGVAGGVHKLATSTIQEFMSLQKVKSCTGHGVVPGGSSRPRTHQEVMSQQHAYTWFEGKQCGEMERDSTKRVNYAHREAG